MAEIDGKRPGASAESTRLEDLTMEETERRATLHEYVEVMEYVAGAELVQPIK